MMRYISLVRNISNWWLHFAVKMGFSFSDPLIFKARNNIIIEVPIRLRHEFKEIFMERCYSKGITVEVPDQPVIIDIGANIGLFSLFAASKFPGARIFSYEPIPVNFIQLKRNQDINKESRIICYQQAVSGSSGEIELHFDSSDSFTTSASITNGENQGDKIKVQCVTLPEIFRNNDIEHCDLLKIDCEGAEYDLLYNCSSEYLNLVTQMVVEVHEGKEEQHNIKSLEEYLKSCEFNTKCMDNMLWAWR
ncbi:MAG: FkbM family methyltransferase [Desulfobacterales bacterium]|jgi:FkbM family methyltransferase|nr:FkbM family methyltransferase [Desulfobacteraceae bacterium]MBT4364421.1 FkbM family methyltransferase [Desulfobacteraceae bacterium]MBT7085684.1 FkbM family methyltransferase [Desulfobacterales bacterium]MBT7696219.1 FkbM family methyltransferase [Desulfobacterales bacterium]